LCNNVNNNKIHFLSETKKEIISVIFKRLYNLAILIKGIKMFDRSVGENSTELNRSIYNLNIW